MYSLSFLRTLSVFSIQVRTDSRELSYDDIDDNLSMIVLMEDKYRVLCANNDVKSDHNQNQANTAFAEGDTLSDL